MKLTTLSICLLTLWTVGAHAEKLDLAEGTMSLGGVATFVVNSYIPGQPIVLDSIPSNAFGWNTSLSFGYFVVDGLSLDFDFTTQGRFTDPVSGAGVGVAVGTRYFFDLDSMFVPYAGILPGSTWYNGFNGNDSFWTLNLTFTSGFLIALNSQVAVDIGARGTLGWGLSQSSLVGTYLDAAIGYMGAKAFF